MNILLISPWENRWIGYMKAFFESRGHTLQWTTALQPVAFLRWADVVICGWANEHAIQLSKVTPELKFTPYICYIRSYELLENCLAKQVNWERFDHAIFVNPAFPKLAQGQGIDFKTCEAHFLPNAINAGDWPLQEHQPGKNLAFVADWSMKKGLQLLAQIFLALPDDYHLWMAGEKYRQDRRFTDSFLHLMTETGLLARVHDCGKVDDIQAWLKDKDYLLSTSPLEGCPNNVLEAMALGIKPVIFNWPGSHELFAHGDYKLRSPWVFNKVWEAVEMVTGPDYDSSGYRRFVEEWFSPTACYTPLLQLIEESASKYATAKEAVLA